VGYRDDLEAALARIELLEGQLSESPDSVEENRHIELLKDIEERKLQAERSERVINRLRERLYGEPSQLSELEQLPTLLTHNRTVGLLLRGRKAEVLCFQCITIGNRVEMIFTEQKPVELSGGEALASVICPNCASLGQLRVER